MHHRLDGHEFEKAPGVGDGQGSLACCCPWVRHKETQLGDWTELKIKLHKLHCHISLFYIEIVTGCGNTCKYGKQKSLRRGDSGVWMHAPSLTPQLWLYRQLCHLTTQSLSFPICKILAGTPCWPSSSLLTVLSVSFAGSSTLAGPGMFAFTVFIIKYLPNK